MAYDEVLAERIRDVLVRENTVEKRMFGGLCFMVGGHMCCGIAKDQLMLRIGPDAWAEALTRPHAKEMDFTGRSLEGMIYVADEGVEEDEDLEQWIRLALGFVKTLPPKKPKAPKKPAAAKR